MKYLTIVLITLLVFSSCKRNKPELWCTCTYNYQSNPRLNNTENKTVRKIPDDSKYLTTYNYANGQITGAKRIGASHGVSKTLVGKVYYSLDCQIK